MKKSLISVFAAMIAVLMAVPQAKADAVADFYRGKTVSIYVSVAAGGLYSTFAQMLAKYFGSHIPGNPTVIVKHLTGAGGLRANNFVYNAAPKDGTVVLTPVSGLTKNVVLGGSKVRLAMEKGEVHGFCGQFAGWKTRKPEWLKEGKLAHLVQLASKRSADMPDVRLLSEFARNDEEREIFSFIQSGIEDRAMLVAPGVPAERVAALEKAFMATLADPAFLAHAKKIKFDIQPVSGAEIRKFVASLLQMKPATVVKLRKAIGLE